MVRTSSDALAWVSAVGASVLLNVEGSAACSTSTSAIVSDSITTVRQHCPPLVRILPFHQSDIVAHTAASAQNVRLVVALSERRSTLGCCDILVTVC